MCRPALKAVIGTHNKKSYHTSTSLHNCILIKYHKVSRTPDGIPAYFLKRVSGPLLDVICFLFKLSLSKGVIPLQ